jgi:HTH-type transcriptional regulator/antitoxin HigA
MQNMIKRNGKMMTVTTDNPYGNLLLDFLPRVIKTETDYMAVQEQVDRLADRDVLSPAEQDYLELLGTLIWEYEARTEDEAEYELRGIELLKGLMELHGLKQLDLVSIFKTKSIVSAVLNGKRQLTVEHINKLACFFKVSHELFFESLDAEKV